MHDEDSKGLERGGEPELAAEVRRAAGDYERAAGASIAAGATWCGASRGARGVELWTSSATHALLPLLATDAGLRLQLATGAASHQRRFGDFGGGFWLPECAYDPGWSASSPTTACAPSASTRPAWPASTSSSRWRTEAGAVALPIDWPTVELVWNDRAATRRTRPIATTTAERFMTCAPGTTPGAPTTTTAALELAGEHARDFVARVRADARASAAAGLLCCALDTELLGHWWYEGPAWLRAVLEQARARGPRAGHGREGDRAHRARAERELGPPPGARQGPLHLGLASGGRGRLHGPARRAAHGGRRGLRHGPRPALERAARELLALQSSDWAFLVTRGWPPTTRCGALAATSPRMTPPSPLWQTQRSVPEPALRNLAPDLDLAPLAAP